MYTVHKSYTFHYLLLPVEVTSDDRCPSGCGTSITASCLGKQIFFFASGVYVFLSTLRFSTLFHNDPAAHQDHCGRCRIRTRDICLRSLVRYQWVTTSPNEPPHLQMSHHISRWATISPTFDNLGVSTMHMTRGWPVSWELLSTGHPVSSVYSYCSEQAV